MKLSKYLAAALLLIAPATFAAPASDKDDKDEAKRLENAGTVIDEILNVPDNISQDLLDKARCVVVLPATQPELTPGHPPAGHQASVERGRGEHQREVQHGGSQTALAGQRPDRRAGDRLRDPGNERPRRIEFAEEQGEAGR